MKARGRKKPTRTSKGKKSRVLGRYSFKQELAREMRACTDKELQFGKLQPFDPEKDGFVGKLPPALRRQYAVAQRYARRSNNHGLSERNRVHFEIFARIVLDMILVEARKIFKRGNFGAPAVRRGGILVNGKGKSSTLND